MQPAKPGVKTSELWVTVACVVLGALMASGVIAEGSQAAQIAGAILAALGAGTYSVSRGMAKSAE